MVKKDIEITFNLYFKPYSGDEGLTSSHILKESLQHINNIKLQGKGILIDRHEGRKNSDFRNLFISSASYIPKEKKYKCKIALLRENRLPNILNRKNFKLTPITELEGRAIAETTNFYIDISNDVPLVCCEYNYHGPRISDIEFYLRQISSQILKISTSCKASIHMKLPINEVLGSLEDVLKFDMKVKPERLQYLNQSVDHAFVTNMTGLANTVQPRFIKVEAHFRERSKNKSSSIVKNNSAIRFVKKILNLAKDDNEFIDDFEDFNLTYEKSDGSEDIFHLIKGKQEIVLICPISSPGIPDSKKMKAKVMVKFNEYIKSN